MKIESRYLVLKYKDLVAAKLTEEEHALLNNICNKVVASRKDRGKPEFECLVVERDWPEWAETGMAIAGRVAQENGKSYLSGRIEFAETYLITNAKFKVHQCPSHESEQTLDPTIQTMIADMNGEIEG
jgi:hypothetical protein